MADRDLRKWIAQLEAEGDFKRVTTQVDWDDEISQIMRKVYVQDGPAILFDHIPSRVALPAQSNFYVLLDCISSNS